MPLPVRMLYLLAIFAAGIGPAGAGEPSDLDLNAVWDASPATMFVRGDTLHYYGKLDDSAVEPLARLLEQAPTSLAQLRIASPGGHALGSIAIAEMIHARDLEVVVVGKGCGSASANYVFTPARRKSLSPGSMVVWHYSCPSSILDDPVWMREQLLRKFGTPSFDFSYEKNGHPVTDPEELRQEFEAQLDDYVGQLTAYVRELRAGHQRIFEGTGIDDRIICLTDHLDLPDVSEQEVGHSYTLPVEDMARFGVCGVSAPDDYAERSEALIQSREDLRGLLGVVRLAEHPEFQPRYPADYCDRPATDHAPAADAGSPTPQPLK